MNNQIDPNMNGNQQPGVQPVQQQVPVQQPVMQPVYNQPAPVVQKTSGVCIAAIIFAFLIPLVGLILGIVGIGSAKKNGGKGKGLAIAAIIISILMPVILVFAIFGLFAGLVSGGTEAGTALKDACSSLDANGNYESSDGYVVCEDYYCEYEKGGVSLSLTCNLIDTDEDEEEEEEETELDNAPVVEQPKDKLAKLCQTYATSVNESTFYHNGKLYSGSDLVNMSDIFDENGLFKQGEICTLANGLPTCILVDEEKNNHAYICSTNQYEVATYNDVMATSINNTGCSLVDNGGNYTDVQKGLTCTNYVCTVTLDGKAYSKSCE